jgi:hypothetical protein
MVRAGAAGASIERIPWGTFDDAAQGQGGAPGDPSVAVLAYASEQNPSYVSLAGRARPVERIVIEHQLATPRRSSLATLAIAASAATCSTCAALRLCASVETNYPRERTDVA